MTVWPGDWVLTLYRSQPVRVDIDGRVGDSHDTPVQDCYATRSARDAAMEAEKQKKTMYEPGYYWVRRWADEDEWEVAYCSECGTDGEWQVWQVTGDETPIFTHEFAEIGERIEPPTGAVEREPRES